MASKGKKDKGSAAPAVVEEPPEKEVVPGKITESQWRDLVCGEESAVVAGEVVEGLVDLAFTVWQDHYLEEQAFPHTIQATKSSLLQIIEWKFLQRDGGEREPENDPTWLEDDEPKCSVIDSWARGIVPQSNSDSVTEHQTPTKSSTVTSSTDNAESPQSGSEVSTTNDLPPRVSSRQPTRASTESNTSTYTTTVSGRPSPARNTTGKAQVTRPRPQARHPQARLLALTRPRAKQCEVTDSLQEREEIVQAPSPAHSHTPTSPPTPSSPPHPLVLPYNMKPAQLRWQKDVTYDSTGNIVDMTRLDPSWFPTHRVRPRVRVANPPPSHSRAKLPRTLPTSTHQHTSPLSLHTARSGKSGTVNARPPGMKRDGAKGGRREGMRGGKRREEVSQGGGRRVEGRVATKESSRFPDVLTLPPLVDTIDVSAGVRVKEDGRSVQGPPSPRRPPHFLVPHTAMLPVHPPPATAGNTVITGDAG